MKPMKRVWVWLGRLTFWISLPVSALFLYRRPRARVLVTAGNKVAVIKNWLGDGRWALPGGGIHYSTETPLVAAQRELGEEINLKLAASQLKSMGHFNYRVHGLLYYRCHCFMVALGKPISLKRHHFEVVDAQWIDRQDLNEHNASPDVLRVLAVWTKG